jgi:hypothetical protein
MTTEIKLISLKALLKQVRARTYVTTRLCLNYGAYTRHRVKWDSQTRRYRWSRLSDETCGWVTPREIAGIYAWQKNQPCWFVEKLGRRTFITHL